MDFTETLVDYGDTLLKWGQLGEAESTFQRAASSVHDTAGMADDVLHAAIATRLGATQRRLGQYENALRNLTQANATHRLIFGEDSQVFGDSLFQLAIVEHISGNQQEAKQHVEESLRIQHRMLNEVGTLASETAMSQLLSTEENRLDLLLSILLANPAEENAAETGFYWTLQSKGLALDLSWHSISVGTRSQLALDLSWHSISVAD